VTSPCPPSRPPARASCWRASSQNTPTKTPPVAAGTQPTDASADSTTDLSANPQAPGGQLAVINLRGAFADHHPSGIEPETLTIQSIVGTLYANFPRIEQVRFLVDGHPRDTLNGHADLTRTYSAVNTATQPPQPAMQEIR
jgi:hypothetical protein